MSKIPQLVSAAKAVAGINSGDSIYVGSSGAVPRILVDALCARGRKGVLHDVVLRHIHTGRTEDYAAPEFEGVFRSESFFIGDNMRRQVQRGAADYIPIALHETQRLIREKVVGCDVALVQVSPPGRHGRVSLGISVDIGRAAIETAKTVIAVINRNMPYTYGDGEIEPDKIDYFVEDDSPLDETHFALPNEIERAIGRHCAELVDDGSCLQLGIGAIPNAVLSQLSDRKDLGVHTEMFADGLLPLVEAGVINGARKRIDRGKIVASFLMGSRKVFDFVNRNRAVRMREVAYTNDPFIIARNPKVVAINSAIQIDLTGQVCADSLGARMYSGVGGQLDFIYGASRSEGGKPIIAIPSQTAKGVSKIVPLLEVGSGVVTPRSHVHYIATEYGIVDLYGKPLQQRARLLIDIAHPDCREELEKAAFERFGKHFLYWK
ncbi:MAG: hypothetical protein LBM70_09290 [Victivallales bacterium]|jgi:acyl-CoA hydrolase|nr:hypothetical protein [Victivallales bacterium]